MRTFQGVVVSNAMNKTIIVRVDRVKMNPKYRKQYTVSRRYHVHDENNKYRSGDKVTFVECRPLSKTKRWRVVEAISHKP
ncbi:30S ribosomal protein S17 [Candidatus Uhrbacteria bacterium RIFCSPLOWO2_12_FULL_46_10]|uniref:Small ribosomal subunit protein uS17 n=1 Tax=Candidatus Uhrbacteria bacterium RIFCSPLOWO2_01_FULL_47_25 TaxID=1802402 RepID=A0A1F7UWZ8_9BACT|nr:MAG: 30S ribosomal protein S17 [Candidatus Uhrbacteria bacterium RIFCSPHIGHO2_01_FULL_46_23]OGL70262.1 MAG: 30S ribosomal protein S17 [Candidatus Uhrbacteria bacterium RIFCSPHIGHO2_02_FULL_47_29]OGL74683.1 MAG: 30S ribosomal protein S17 [Candidatus Uhrbacteria bacterium RIFCSPHIGHO2_12_FULL_46_13]OGL82799.1 MAG: 30S ribosomal protein S17 [Candidatus Uhrbacteria bacterium RIFCSPLOWO2_01_FULL_47_25]OGL83893.1 MAG: 30S ribosomal protein S17 [Candidatus Uhrbacteria bacterium RIFCSPLOWO2_02_FULL_